MSQAKKVSGGCYCGKIRYEISGEPAEKVLCHCGNCRRISGGQAVAWLLSRQADFRYTHGAPRQFRSDTGATWSFCPNCGTTLTYRGAGYDEQIDVVLVSLDDHIQHVPDRDASVAERLPWVSLVGAKDHS